MFMGILRATAGNLLVVHFEESGLAYKFLKR